MSKIRVDTIATQDESTSVPTATLTALPARVTAAETGKAAKGANNDITELNGLTKAITLSQGGHGATTADGARSALGVPGRNRIINGCCRIAQRNNITVNNGVTGYGGPDRYYVSNTAGGAFIQQNGGTIPDGGVIKPAVAQYVSTANTAFTGSKVWSGITQIIEANNCFDMVGSPAAISFIFATNVTGTFSVSLRNAASLRSFVSTFNAVAGTPVKVIVNIPTIPLATAFPTSNSGGFIVNVGGINTGTFSTSTTGSWLTGNFITDPGATNWGASVNNFIALTELQFESGTATPFERRLTVHEIAMCQRYYAVGNAYIAAYNTGGQWAAQQVSFKQTMRSTPTISHTNTGVSNASLIETAFADAGGFAARSLVTVTGACIAGSFWTANAEL